MYLQHIPAEPYSREVTPSQLLNHLITVNEYLSDLYGVVSACNTMHGLHRPKHLYQCVVCAVGVLPTNAIVCRVLLLLLIKPQRLTWMRTCLYGWRAVGRGGRCGGPCRVRGGVRARFVGWIGRAGREKGRYGGGI